MKIESGIDDLYRVRNFMMRPSCKANRIFYLRCFKWVDYTALLSRKKLFIYCEIGEREKNPQLTGRSSGCSSTQWHAWLACHCSAKLCDTDFFFIRSTNSSSKWGSKRHTCMVIPAESPWGGALKQNPSDFFHAIGLQIITGWSDTQRNINDKPQPFIYSDFVAVKAKQILDLNKIWIRPSHVTPVRSVLVIPPCR